MRGVTVVGVEDDRIAWAGSTWSRSSERAETSTRWSARPIDRPTAAERTRRLPGGDRHLAEAKGLETLEGAIEDVRLLLVVDGVGAGGRAAGLGAGDLADRDAVGRAARAGPSTKAHGPMFSGSSWSQTTSLAFGYAAERSARAASYGPRVQLLDPHDRRRVRPARPAGRCASYATLPEAEHDPLHRRRVGDRRVVEHLLERARR